MLFTFVSEYVFGSGCIIQVNASDQDNALKLIKAYKIPAYGDEPEYFPFENTKFRELSSYYTTEITSDGIILIHELL